MRHIEGLPRFAALSEVDLLRYSPEKRTTPRVIGREALQGAPVQELPISQLSDRRQSPISAAGIAQAFQHVQRVCLVGEEPFDHITDIRVGVVQSLTYFSDELSIVARTPRSIGALVPRLLVGDVPYSGGMVGRWIVCQWYRGIPSDLWCVIHASVVPVVDVTCSGLIGGWRRISFQSTLFHAAAIACLPFKLVRRTLPYLGVFRINCMLVLSICRIDWGDAVRLRVGCGRI
jgi:hypothetical protein